MEPILIRYGESLTLPIDTGDSTDVSADIYVGKPGEQYAIHIPASLIGGVGTFVFSSADTSIPKGTYYYQVNVTDVNGYVQKFPSPEEECDGCDDEFPEFIVGEALDESEVS